MANRTVRVPISPSDPEELLNMAASMIEKHEADPASSPFVASEIQQLKTLVESIRPTRLQLLKLRQELQALNEKFLLGLGTGKGQTSKTKGTVYNLVVRMKKQLLLAFEGQEEQLETFGLKVKVSTSKVRSTTKKQAPDQ